MGEKNNQWWDWGLDKEISGLFSDYLNLTLGKPRIRQNILKTSLRFPCLDLNPIIDSINTSTVLCKNRATAQPSRKTEIRKKRDGCHSDMRTVWLGNLLLETFMNLVKLYVCRLIRLDKCVGRSDHITPRFCPLVLELILGRCKLITKYSRTSMAQTPLGPWKYVRARGSSS